MTKKDDLGKCPWNVQPNTVDEMLDACRAQNIWEYENNQQAPYHWCIRLSHKFVENLCTRLIIAEIFAEVNGEK